jgi:O-antigen/teichoic acid export membrane protein
MATRHRITLPARFAGLTQGAFMAVAMVVAGGFDYLVNILVGRWLVPTEFFVFVTITAIVQIMVQVTNVIRNVVAYYTAEATVLPEPEARIGMLLGRSWRWAWRWGLVASVAFALLSPVVARFLRIDTPWPLIAAAFALLLLFLRPVTDGTLQGIQHFFGLGSVQILQSFMRLVFAAGLVWAGLQATGAVVALPLGSTVALILALWLLVPYFRAPDPAVTPGPISWRYSVYTLIGLVAFALMVNADAIIVRRLFGDAAAEAYGPVVTLGKMNLFVPLGIGLVLFPKATQRHAAGRDSRPVLLLALGATLLPGLMLTVFYYLFPGWIVQTVFGDAYRDPGTLLALVGLATTLYAGVSIWLNYALSLERRAFVFILAAIVVLQIGLMLTFHPRLETIALIMIGAGVAGNLAGAATTLTTPSQAANP